MAAADLCTVSDVQTYLSLSSGQDAALIQTLITNASAFVDNYCNRVLLSNDYTETRNGIGGDRMAFRQYPVTAVASVTVEDHAVKPSTGSQTPGYVWDENMLYLRHGTFPRGAQNVVIVYTGGLTAIPADLNQACIEIVALKYKRRTNIDFLSKSLNGEVITFNNADVPASAKSTLSNYARVFMT